MPELFLTEHERDFFPALRLTPVSIYTPEPVNGRSLDHLSLFMSQAEQAWKEVADNAKSVLRRPAFNQAPFDIDIWSCSVSARGNVMERKKLSTTVYITYEQNNLLKLLNQKTKVPIAEYIREGIDLVLERHKQLLPGQMLLLEDNAPKQRRLLEH